MKKIFFTASLIIVTSNLIFSQTGKEPFQKPRREIIEGTSTPPAPTQPPPIREGGLYKEVNSNNIYVIQSGKKVQIPTSSALWLMGYTESQIVTVDAGRLNGFPSFIIKSKSLTPGSIVYPPEGNHIALTGLNGATKIFSRGKEIQLLELRGWFRDIHGDCNEDSPSGYRCANKGRDMHFGFELDLEWAEQQGLDVHKLLRVGNIATGIENYNGILHPEIAFDYSKMVCLPPIRVEFNSWGWICRFPGVKPADWLNNVDASCPDIFWPYAPHFSGVNGNTWERAFELNNRGPYVSITGSIITDDPHDDGGWGHFLANGLWPDVVFRWGGNPKDGNHPARWTEMHPPDNIEILPFKNPKYVTRGVAFSALPTKTSMLEFDIFPVKDGIPRPSPFSKVNFSESTGPESFFPKGRNNDNGILITKFDDHIHVKATIQGSDNLLGSSGRLKSIIKVWWETNSPPPPPPPPASTSIPAFLTGTWKGTYGLSAANSPNFYSFKLNADGTMQLVDLSNTIIASGTYKFINNQLTGSYRYNSGALYSIAANVSGTQLDGTWGSGASSTNGGKWIMNKVVINALGNIR